MFSFLQTFHKEHRNKLLEEEIELTSDVASEDLDTPPQLKSLRIKIMVSTLLDPSATSHLYEIRRLTMSISDQIDSIKFAKWKDLKATDEDRPKWLQIPPSPQDAEQFIDGFHGNINQTKGYYRLHLLYPDTIALDSFQAVFDQLNIPQKQSISIAPEKVLYPSTVGFIKGSTEAMMNSIDLSAILQQSNIEFGFIWKYIQTGKNGKFDRNQKAIYIETNAVDAPKMKKYLTSFFANNNPIFGAHLGFQPISQYGTNTQLSKIRQYAPTQSKLISSLLDLEIEIANFESITLPSQEDKNNSTMLIEALLQLQSITQKKSIKKGKEIHFTGNVFYSAITNASTNLTTFQFFDYNASEATGILRALPLFLRDFFKIPEDSLNKYCRSSHIVEAKNGTWDFPSRSFLDKDETVEREVIEQLQVITSATKVEVPKYIDPDHQRMMTQQDNDEDTTHTDLHAHEEDSSLSENTGSTTTSKAQRYADEVREAMIREIQLQRAIKDKEIERLHQLLQKANIDPSLHSNEAEEKAPIFDINDEATVQTENNSPTSPSPEDDNAAEDSPANTSMSDTNSATSGTNAEETMSDTNDYESPDEYNEEEEEKDNKAEKPTENITRSYHVEDPPTHRRSLSPNKRKKPTSPHSTSPPNKSVIQEADSLDDADL